MVDTLLIHALQHCAKTKVIRWGALQTSATWVAKAGVEGSSCEYFFKIEIFARGHLRCTRQRLHRLTTNRWRKLLLWRRGQLFPCLFASLCCPVIAAQISLGVSVFLNMAYNFLVFHVHELRDRLVFCSNDLSMINDLSFWSWPAVRECSVFCCCFLATIFWNLAGSKRELDELVAFASLVWIGFLGERIMWGLDDLWHKGVRTF